MFRFLLKWSGTWITAMLALALVVSMDYAIDWRSPTGSYTLGLSCGGMSIAWRPVGYEPASDRFRGPSGFGGFADYAGSGFCWPVLWPAYYQSQALEGPVIPAWIPLAAFLLPTTWLWWRDWGNTRALMDRMGRKLCPVVPVRMTFRLIAICFAAHLAFVFVLGMYLRRYGESDYLLMVVVEGTRILTIVMPVLTPLWAWLIVRYRNRLLREYGSEMHCVGCGFDLTGNVSGVCPECGTPRAASAIFAPPR